jgi:hypothetical protein
MKIRRVRTNEGDLYRQARLDALKEAPDAFSSTYADALSRSKESWINQNDEAASGGDRAIFLALSEEKVVGLTAVYRQSKVQYSRLVATVAPENEDVVEFYQILGFKKEGETVDGQVFYIQI